MTRVALLLLATSVFAQTSHDSLLRSLKFRSIGPAVMGGRVDDFAVVENDPRIFYVGTAAGGVLKTTNGGTTWEPVFDEVGAPSIGDVTLAPSNPAILYVGTGEANNRQSSSWGHGVYKSMDGGKTWKHVGLKDTFHIGRIVVHPTNPDVVYVAALGDLWGPNPDRGVFMSTDGGATWNRTLYIDEDTGVSDLAIDPQSPNVLYAAAYMRRRTVFGYNGGGPKGGLYRSLDGGKTWEKMTKGLPASGDVGRCAVEVYRKNSNIVYALVEHMTLGGVYRSDDKGASWTRQSDTNPRPSYYSQIRVDPNNENKVWVLGAPLYMSEDGGRTFTQARGNGIHSDHHAMWIDPANGDHLIIGNDGGVHVTWDAGRHWDFLNNVPIGQFYEVAYDFQRPYHVCGGLQDNYSWCGPSANVQNSGIGNDEWININGGDGFHARIDPTDANIIYSESQDGNLTRRDMRTGDSKLIRPQEDSDASPRYRFQWNSPLIISPHDPKTIYYGGNHLFKSTDRGDTWVRLGEDLTTAEERNKKQIFGKTSEDTTLSKNDGVVDWPCLTAIAESYVKQGVLWGGTDDGNLQISRDGGNTWHNVVSHIQGVPKGAYVSRIEASHKDEGVAYVTFDNHRSGDFAIYIFMTRNYGDSWTRITNGIPLEAGTVHVIREDPVNSNLLFAGTEFGLFVSFNRGANWERLKSGLPPTPVFDLQIHPREHDLILATHGRSIWIMDNITPLEEAAGNEKAITDKDVHLFSGVNGVEWKMLDYRGFLAQRNYYGTNPQSGLLLDYHLKAAGPVQVAIKDGNGKQIRSINARGEAGANRLAWDMRMDPAVPVAGGGRGGRGGAGGGGGAAGGGGRGGRGAAAGSENQAFQAPESGGGAPGEPGAEAAAGGGGGGGGGGFGGFGRGSLVDPGRYTVTLTAAGKTETRTVMVEDDPRSTITADDRAKRRTAITRLSDMAKQADEARRKIVAMNTALTNLTDGWKRPGVTVPDAARKAADDMAARIKPALAMFEPPRPAAPAQLGAAGSRGPYTPPPVNQKITRLLGMIEGYAGGPTSKQMSEVEDCAALLAKGMAAVNPIFDDFPKLNKALADAGLSYMTVDTNAVPAATFGRGGGR
ncbi:MAG TPA: hypothetical protein VKE70_27620 [Candidatus Solibacter sp.]|nr:hypothetical protein [Candidatus Solibacter sp.]